MKLLLVHLLLLAVVLLLTNAKLESKVKLSRTANKVAKNKSESKKRVSDDNTNGNNNTNANRKLLPKLPYHPDNCFLIEFHSDNNPLCDQMEPVMERLENDLQTKFRRINISKRAEFINLYEIVGGTECNELPFFYNRRTCQAICGPTTYKNLKLWGMGKLTSQFKDTPENLLKSQAISPGKRKDVGLKGFFMEKISGIDKKKENSSQEKTKSKK